MRYEKRQKQPKEKTGLLSRGSWVRVPPGAQSQAAVRTEDAAPSRGRPQTARQAATNAHPKAGAPSNPDALREAEAEVERLRAALASAMALTTAAMAALPEDGPAPKGLADNLLAAIHVRLDAALVSGGAR